MREKRRILFSSKWSSENINIDVERYSMVSFYLKLFFKNWILLEPKNSKYNVVVNFTKTYSDKEIKQTLFSYYRENNEETIITSISKLNIIRALIRSIYKIFNKKANVVGVSELYMSVIRTTIIEPIEYLNYINGWRLIHASVFKLDDKTFIVSAGSKVGKSTLVSKLKKQLNCDILSDNYCFIKDNKVRTIEEPIRGGQISRFKTSFYGRTINGYPDNFEEKIDCFIILKRGIKNQVKNLDYKGLNLFVNKTNNTEKEGISYLGKDDPISVKNKDVELKGSYILKELEVAEGLENIQNSINLIKSI